MKSALPRIDSLGVVLVAAGSASLLFLPFVVFKSNRIVPGNPCTLAQVLPAWGALGCAAALALAGGAALWAVNARVRLLLALLGVVAVAAAAAAAGDALTPPGDRIVRIAPGGAFWVLTVCLGLLATDAMTRLRPRPAVRVLFLAFSLTVMGLTLAHGTFDHLSVMREYAVNATRFAHEARRHLELAFGSLAAAVVVALPLGVLCHRRPRLQARCPRHAQRHPDHPGDRALRHPDGTARRARRRRAARRPARDPRHRRGAGRGGVVPLLAACRSSPTRWRA